MMLMLVLSVPRYQKKSLWPERKSFIFVKKKRGSGSQEWYGTLFSVWNVPPGKSPEPPRAPLPHGGVFFWAGVFDRQKWSI